jgi:hypothetical protein
MKKGKNGRQRRKERNARKRKWKERLINADFEGEVAEVIVAAHNRVILRYGSRSP